MALTRLRLDQPLLIGDAGQQLAGDGGGVRAEAPLDDAGVPDAVQAAAARTARHLDDVAAAIVLKRHVRRLVHVADPVTGKLQRVELVLVAGGRRGSTATS